MLNQFQTDGVVVLRKLLSPALLALLEKGVIENLAQLSPRAKIASPDSDPGLFLEDFCNWQHNEYYKEFIFTSPLSKIAAELMQSNTVRLYHDHLLIKKSNTSQKTPWHQDQPYYNIAGRQNCSFWIPLDPVTQAASLQFIRGSHLGPWYMPRTFIDHEAKWFAAGTLQEIPDIENNPTDYPILSWALQPGDVICFHMLTLHAAAGSTQERRAFSVRMLGDDIIHAPRPWQTSPDFPGLDTELPAGAPLNHPLFPLLH